MVVASAHQTAVPVTKGKGREGGEQSQAPLLALLLAGFCITVGRSLNLPMF